ncbi:dihydropteroate synthase [Salirhabdus euzebyi]|uniref:Dihydropteroate synthase n=1 Tax=Salirhabdus euzebyi TaxID=394506 RepID=A0A841Q9B3_9BACI|nr:dihydropteroate synthase [Salirhabdus euzebyi]MBB6455269.1 dihydropteroate synthase [Salirhabdus euzebyi]
MAEFINMGKYRYDLSKHTLIMGILNVTPDSFSDGGKFNELDHALIRATRMQEQGAHIIDVGGESTRPGHEPVTAEEELARVVPIIRALQGELNVPISVDTYKAEVAEQAVNAGASLINDVWGAKKDPQIADVAAQHNVPLILMHNRDNKDYHDLITDMKKDLESSIEIAIKAGVKSENIILDPGIGFAKSMEDNLVVMRHLDELTSLGFPILLGTSRKSFIEYVLNLPVNERMEGTGATVCLGIERGANIVRVHDVKEMARMAKMMDAMLGKGVR